MATPNPDLQEQISELKKLVLQQSVGTKSVLTLKEAAIYLGCSRSHLYKLTSAGTIPHYKPEGKKIFLNREELEGWCMRNYCYVDQEEIEAKAATYVAQNPKGGVS